MSENYSPPVKAVLEALKERIESRTINADLWRKKGREDHATKQEKKIEAIASGISEIKAALDVVAKQRKLEEQRITPWPGD